MARYTATIYERAEYWTFDAYVDAKDITEARKMLQREFPKKDYRIVGIDFDNTYAGNFLKLCND